MGSDDKLQELKHWMLNTQTDSIGDIFNKIDELLGVKRPQKIKKAIKLTRKQQEIAGRIHKSIVNYLNN